MAKDPYRYFRVEAKGFLDGLARGALDLEKGIEDAEGTARLLRLAHTLKGAARVVKQAAIADRAHEIEAVLAARRDGEGGHAIVDAEKLLGLLDEAREALALIGGEAPSRRSPKPPPPAVPAAPSRPEAPREALSEAPAGEGRPLPHLLRLNAAREPSFETVRVSLDELDDLIVAVAQAGVRLESVRARVAQGAAVETRGGGLRDDVQKAEADLAFARESAHRLRLVPAGEIFETVERAARDAARALGKEIDLAAGGAEVRLDGHVLGAVRDGLIHVVRNAVDHGIESPETRVARGKPISGRIRLSVERRGRRVVFTCTDDGGGIDVAAVAAAARRRGLPEEAARALDLDGAVRLLLRGGLTTREHATAVSGRGVGLDAVRAAAERLKGEVRLSSRPGLGTSVVVIVPVSLSSLRAIVVEAGGAPASLPLDAVRRALSIFEAEIARDGERASVAFEGAAVPFASLADLLGAAAGAAPRTPMRARTVLVLGDGDRLAAIGVDRIVASEDIVVRPLPALCGALPLVAGASLDAGGRPRLLLDPRGVISAAHRSRAAVATLARGGETPPRTPPAEGSLARRAHPPILVIDDSLTTRMLESAILEAAGFEVDLAVSGEEGLAKARARRYGLFIVDYEMPGMDGIEFTALSRADPALAGTPAVMVTSRSAPEDRKRAQDAGAAAYIVKSEFEQSRFLETVRRLIA